jgi:hypothetical protein
MLPNGGPSRDGYSPAGSLLSRNSIASEHVFQRVMRLQFVELDALFEALERQRTI